MLESRHVVAVLLHVNAPTGLVPPSRTTFQLTACQRFAPRLAIGGPFQIKRSSEDAVTN